jgi:uncharacterized protein
LRSIARLLLLGALFSASLLQAFGLTPGREPKKAAASGVGDSITRAISRDRKETRKWLQSDPSSYLAAIQRVEFGMRNRLVIGSAPDCDVLIEDPVVAPHHCEVTVAGDSFHVRVIDAGATFAALGSVRTEAVLPPSSVGIGRFTIRLSHQHFPAIIVFDPLSPRFKEYKGIMYFPVSPAYRFVLPLKQNGVLDTVIILSSRGNRRKALRVGWFAFMVKSVRCSLEVSRLLEPGVGEKSHSIFFRDRTCGRESYGMGRYVEAVEQPDGRFVLDFNAAYNPACAFSPYYNCPVPPAHNDLPVRIPAGEMDSGYIRH